MILSRRDETAEQSEALADILARIHAELEDVARRIDLNQATIAKATWEAGAGNLDYVRAMQDADLSAQRIVGVAGFLRAIGDQAHAHWRIDTATATAGLKLADLARSIGATAAPAASRDEEASGHVDLF